MLEKVDGDKKKKLWITLTAHKKLIPACEGLAKLKSTNCVGGKGEASFLHGKLQKYSNQLWEAVKTSSNEGLATVNIFALVNGGLGNSNNITQNDIFLSLIMSPNK